MPIIPKTRPQQTRYLVNPTVLIVEDNVDHLNDISEKFTANTTLGVLPVSSIREAMKYLTPKSAIKYNIRSVFADQEFATNAQSNNPRLQNGLDLLTYVSKRQPSMGLYLNTVHGADETLLKDAKNELGTTSRVFMKGERRSPGQEYYACVERDYLTQALRSESAVQQAAVQDQINILDARQGLLSGDVEIADKLRHLFDAHRVTYLRAMGSEGIARHLSFGSPVEVVCIREGDGTYTARALGLGVLQEGVGPDAWEAQMELADRIVEVYLDLKATTPKERGKFANKVWHNLEAVICDEPSTRRN